MSGPFDDRDTLPEPPDPWCDRCGDTGWTPYGPCPKCNPGGGDAA